MTLDLASKTANPAAQAFLAAGEWCLRMFGVIFRAAAITWVVGASCTSVSFMPVFRPMDERARDIATVILITVPLAIDPMPGTAPAALLDFAGGFNGLILPIGLTILTWIGFARA